MHKKLKNRLVVNSVSIILGFVIGLAINLGWQIFRGFILGWGDSAPEWYFNIQGYVHNGIFIVALIICIVFANIFFIPKDP